MKFNGGVIRKFYLLKFQTEKSVYMGNWSIPQAVVHKNSESDPSEVKRNIIVAKRNDIFGNITSWLV